MVPVTIKNVNILQNLKINVFLEKMLMVLKYSKVTKYQVATLTNLNLIKSFENFDSLPVNNYWYPVP
jgi:hypothetical protein